MKVKFEREKETKNTIKYHEVGEQGKPSIVGTLYLQKWYAGDCKERAQGDSNTRPADS